MKKTDRAIVDEAIERFGPQPRQFSIPGVGTVRQMTSETRNYSLRKNYKGRRDVISLKTSDPYEAAEQARKESNRLIEKYGRGELIDTETRRLKFEDMAEMIKSDYDLKGNKSKDRLEDSINHLASFFSRFRAVDITGARITAYAEYRHKEEGASLGTIHNELAALKRMVSLAQRAGHLFRRPAFPTISLNNARQGFFEELEFQAVEEHLPEEIKPIGEFAYNTGWRTREILNLQWESNVNLRAGIIRLEPGTTKNNEGRTFPFDVLPKLKELIEKQRQYTDEVEKAKGIKIPWVFHRNGEQIKSFKMAWKKAVKEAGISNRVFHDFRRTAVRNLERAGVSRSVAMKLTGHKTEAVYRRYAIVSESDLAEGVGKLAALHGQQPSPSPVEEEKKFAVGGGVNIVGSGEVKKSVVGLGKVISFPGRK